MILFPIAVEMKAWKGRRKEEKKECGREKKESLQHQLTVMCRVAASVVTPSVAVQTGVNIPGP
jgi:hypothetical protein